MKSAGQGKKVEYGVFCQVYGKNLRNLVIEYLLENRRLDFAVGDMAEELKISRPKAYEIVKELGKEGFVKKSRIVAGTQLYLVNEKDKKVKLLLNNFKECIKLVLEEYEEKHGAYSAVHSGAGVASAKHI